MSAAGSTSILYGRVLDDRPSFPGGIRKQPDLRDRVTVDQKEAHERPYFDDAKLVWIGIASVGQGQQLGTICGLIFSTSAGVDTMSNSA